MRKCSHGIYIAEGDQIALYCSICLSMPSHVGTIQVTKRVNATTTIYEVKGIPIDWGKEVKTTRPRYCGRDYELQPGKVEAVLLEAHLAMHVGRRCDKLDYGCVNQGYRRHPDKPGKWITYQHFDYEAPNGQDGKVFKKAALRLAMLGNTNALGKKYKKRKRRPQTPETRAKISKTRLLRIADGTLHTKGRK